MKDQFFDFDRIKLLFLKSDNSDSLQVISEDVCDDFDFEELFMHLDHTKSKPGQQLLYKYLRTIPNDRQRVDQLEEIISQFQKNESQRNRISKLLSRLNQPGSYYLPALFKDSFISRPKWQPVLPALSILTLMVSVLSFFFPLALFALLGLVLINSFFHFWNKGNVLSYANALPQLQLLRNVSIGLLNEELPFENRDEFKKSISTLKSISQKAAFLQLENNVRGEIGQVLDYIFDLIKIIFLIEPIAIFSIQKELKYKREDVKKNYLFVARIDVALSIYEIRTSLPRYATPDIKDNYNALSAARLYHPLTSDPVANDLSPKPDHSLLISGSNMSGKTTFIRAVGINLLMGQTINTVCAEKFAFSPIKIFSAIRINDNLLNDDSYYFKEVKTIKAMIKEAGRGSRSIFLLDELFKGTNTRERVAAGKAVLSYLAKGPNVVIAATHDLELTEMLADSYELYHFSDTIDNDQLVFDYKLKQGVLSNTNAIKILELNDYPKEIIKEAMDIATRSK